MAKLIYSVLGSLDGYFEGIDGSFDWAMPDEDGFAFVNHLERPIEPVPLTPAGASGCLYK